MICPYCGKETKDDAQFCAACGHQIARCPSCNRVLRTNAKFCGFDGTALPPELLRDLPAPAAAPVPPRRTPVTVQDGG
ncbi:MAG: zinc ribbon domain-containing protein [Clostridiales bacterium]|nr:zinc ribbon domain-containing protein [Clostridiales bacterium]